MAARALVFDIEGTTTPISFVYDVLFPYARQNMRTFVHAHIEDDELQAVLRALHEELTDELGAAVADERLPLAASPEDQAQALTKRALDLMDEDRKSTGLKQLQGLIWKRGYAAGSLEGVVFDDVPEAFAELKTAGLPLYIYSSGSIAAQRLIFGHSNAGDLTPLLSGYFDTTTGPKKEAQSYRDIAAAIEAAAADILFCTDNPDEARAARAAGWQVRLVCRPGNPEVAAGDFTVIERFDEAFIADALGR